MNSAIIQWILFYRITFNYVPRLIEVALYLLSLPRQPEIVFPCKNHQPLLRSIYYYEPKLLYPSR
jgi:hypothetical protein